MKASDIFNEHECVEVRSWLDYWNGIVTMICIEKVYVIFINN